MQKWIQPPACSDRGLHRILTSYWLAHFYLMKRSAALFWFGLQDVGIHYSQAVIQRTIDVSPAFLEHGSAEKIAVWAHANCDPHKQEAGFNFAWSGSKRWTNIQDQISKTFNVWCPFQGLSGIQWYHSHADSIVQTIPLKGQKREMVFCLNLSHIVQIERI